MKSLSEKLREVAEKAADKIDDLEEQVEYLKEGDEWGWRHLRKLSKEENMDLPLPRLEIRYRKTHTLDLIADYGLIYEHLLGHIEFVPFGSTKCGGERVSQEGYLDMPFRAGGHMYNDMWHLKLPGYVTNGTYIKKVTLDDWKDFPGGLVTKMKASGMVFV